MIPSSELRARVLAAARNHPAPTRAQVQRRELIAGVAAALWLLILFGVGGGVRAAPRPPGLIGETLVGGSAIAAVAAGIAFSRGRSTLGRGRSWLATSIVMTPVALFAWKVLASAQFENMTRLWPERVGARCFWLSCAMAVVPLLVLVTVRRETDPLHPARTGAALGAALGALVWVLVDLNCPVAYVPHLLLGHVLPLVSITLWGGALGERFMALRGATKTETRSGAARTDSA